MGKDIKTRETIKNIKTKSNKNHLEHFIKKKEINMKNDEVEQEEFEENKQESYAIEKVENITKATAFSSARHFNKSNKTKNKKQGSSLNVSSIQKMDMKTKDKEITDYKIKSKNAIKNKDYSKSSNTQNIKRKSYTHRSNHYTQQMKQSTFMKHKKAAKDSIHTTKTISLSKDSLIQKIKNAFQLTTSSARKISQLFNNSIGCILLLVIILFIGCFSSLAYDGGINQEILPLSEEVLAYEETIIKYAQQYDIEDYVTILEAIMMHESKGLGHDPMKSSECDLNTKYPQKPNGIEEPEYSIQVGVQHFSRCLSISNTEYPNNTEGLYLALQGYNYGYDYINWALTHFGGYSKANAKVYADNKRYELNISDFGDPNYVEHVMQYVSFSFRGLYNPNFHNDDAWIDKNPYAKEKLYGQCTWFAWGRFYELYGYSPGFIGNGYECVDQLLKAHPDKFERSPTPKAGAIFSSIGRNHVGIVIAVKGDILTIQEGNLDGKTNSFQEAQTDWHTIDIPLSELIIKNQGVIFANPKV